MSENDFSSQRTLGWLKVLSATVAVAGGATSMSAHATQPPCKPWAASNVYTSGDTATENGKSYKAN